MKKDLSNSFTSPKKKRSKGYKEKPSSELLSQDDQSCLEKVIEKIIEKVLNKKLGDITTFLSLQNFAFKIPVDNLKRNKDDYLSDFQKQFLKLQTQMERTRF